MPFYLYRCPVCGRDHDVARTIEDRNAPFYCEALHEQTACQRIVTPPVPIVRNPAAGPRKGR